VDSDPINLINNARKDLQTVTNLVNTYERTRDVDVLNDIVKLSLSIYDNAIKAFLAVKGIRVRDLDYLVQVAHDFIPSEIISSDLRDFLIKCSSTECSADSIVTRVRDLDRLVDYVHTASTHRAVHNGL
jgi:hypothetical protein